MRDAQEAFRGAWPAVQSFVDVALGRYELVRLIGAGGMAEVHEARLHGSSGFTRTVVVKRILPERANDPRSREMFLAEARIAGILRHPNIVPVFDLGKDGDRLYLAMEHVDGLDLARALSRAWRHGHALPVGDAVRIATEVLSALAYVHARSDEQGRPLFLVHRDVSPQNVLLSRFGEVKLGDFGISKGMHRKPMTDAGLVRGTLRWMAPEQVSNQRLDGRTDLYAVGMLLHVMLCGRHPFDGLTDGQIIERLGIGDVPAPSTFLPTIPNDLDAIVRRAISLYPRSRFANATEMIDALDEFSRRSSTVATPRTLSKLVELLLDDSPIRPPDGPTVKTPRKMRGSTIVSPPGTA